MEEDFKVIAVVKFNDDEALVLNRPIEMIYEEDGRSYVGTDGPFKDFLAYGGSSGNMKAFAGRELSLTMKDGSVRKIKDNWWATWKKGYKDVVVKDLEGLKRCYVFNSAHITPEDYAALRESYTGPVYPYWDYEKIIKYDDERKYWIGKCFEAQKKLDTRNKRDALISNLLMGRSTLLRALEHTKNWQRFMDLKCSLEDKDGFLHGLDHIGLWKAAIKEAEKEPSVDLCEDELFEVNECPRCSSIYASYKARRIMKAKLGTINRILTRMGNNMRKSE